MNTEEVAEAAKQLGMEEGLITGVQNLISVLRDYGEDNQNILQQLKQKYGNTFSDKQLEDFLKQS